MKKFILTILTTSLIFGVAINCKKKSDEEFVAEFGKTVCYKVADCTAEKMKGMPEAQMEQMKAMMPSRESCDKRGNEKEHKTIVLTSEEKALGQKCIDEMKKVTCDEMSKEIPSCKEFSEIIVNKEKS